VRWCGKPGQAFHETIAHSTIALVRGTSCLFHPTWSRLQPSGAWRPDKLTSRHVRGCGPTTREVRDVALIPASRRVSRRDMRIVLREPIHVANGARDLAKSSTLAILSAYEGNPNLVPSGS